MKDAAQDVAEDVAQGVVEDVLDAAKDGSLKVLVFARVTFQRRNPHPTHAFRPPRLPLGDTREGRAREERGRAWRRTWPSGPERRAPSSPRHHRRRRRLCAAGAEMGAQMGCSVAFGSGCGQALPGVPRKAPLSL